MVLVEWNESYSVGHALIDAHHKIFFEMISRFVEQPCQGDQHAMQLRIELLLDYITMHFSAEEKLLREINYPDFERHKAEHDNFHQTTLSIFMDKDLSCHTEEEILTILQDWFQDHILGEDRLFVSYIM